MLNPGLYALNLYRQLQNEAWLERDRKSHAEFCEKKEKEEQKLREREEREVAQSSSDLVTHPPLIILRK